MPTVKNIPGPYRFFFYSFDCNEPKHVHVKRERKICKFWLEPVMLSKNYGFSPRELILSVRLFNSTETELWRLGMNTAINIVEPRIRDIHVTEEEITAYLVDARTISVPLAWSWRLSEATPEQRSNFKIIGDGQGIHWQDIDEDISVEGMLHGIPARRPKRGYSDVSAIGVGI